MLFGQKFPIAPQSKKESNLQHIQLKCIIGWHNRNTQKEILQLHQTTSGRLQIIQTLLGRF